ncbi:MAG: DNA primase [Chloroflexota bacterium]|nr:MAG: DNA primase [Chloroflexota bacterium]
MSTIDEIKNRIDIVDLVSETVQLRKSGKNYTGFCPFHSNTRTPAFVVFPETASWRCFGQCNEGGDIFGFVMKKEGWDFSEALRNLAEKAGVELRPLSPTQQEEAEEHEHLRKLLEDAVAFFRHNLLNTPAGNPVLDYLHQERGLNDRTIEEFGLGYAPNSWEAGFNHFSSKGYSQEDIIASGLVSVREEADGDDRSAVYDRFRHRIMFPIRDERGRMAGFGARIINPEDVPKFLNSPQTVLFDKSHLLYGLDKAKKEIRKQSQVVIVEGYLDVITLHQEGFPNAVSPMGTALTEYQLRLLKRFSRNMVLALDADAAGDKATLRGLEIARQSLDREADPVFDARGMLGNEARLNADIRVTTLPEGLDPDEVVMQDTANWERIISEARPIVIHVMETLVRDQNLDDPKVKSRIANQVLPLIADVPDSVEREAYRQRLARLIKVNERAFTEATVARRPRRPLTRKDSAEVEIRGSRKEDLPIHATPDLLESHCLGVLLRRPELVYKVDRALQENGLNRLSINDFQSGDHQALLQLVDESLKQDHAEPELFVQNSLSLPLMELVDQLLMKTDNLDPNEDKVLEDLVRTVLVLRQRRLYQQIEHIQYLMEEPQITAEDNLVEYQNTMVQYIAARNRLDRALGFYTSHMIQ